MGFVISLSSHPKIINKMHTEGCCEIGSAILGMGKITAALQQRNEGSGGKGQKEPFESIRSQFGVGSFGVGGLQPHPWAEGCPAQRWVCALPEGIWRQLSFGQVLCPGWLLWLLSVGFCSWCCF